MSTLPPEAASQAACPEASSPATTAQNHAGSSSDGSTKPYLGPSCPSLATAMTADVSVSICSS